MHTVSLASLCTRISSGGTPNRKHPEYFSDDGGHLWVKSQELVDRHITDTGEKITDLGLAKSSAKYYDADSVLIAMYGATVGQLAILKVPATVNQAICALCIDPAKADYRYVFYALMATRHDLVVQAAGAAQQNLNQGLIRDFEIPIFPLKEQRRIAHILGSVDNLIEKNRWRIEILEEMARLIYQEWFVHFRFPGYEDVEFVDSILGPIPKAWQAGPLRDVTDFINRGIAPMYDDDSPSIVINQRCIRDHRISMGPARRHTKKVPPAKYVRLGDVLVNSTGIGTLGRVAPVQQDLNDTTVDSHVTIIRPGAAIDIDYFAQLVLSLESQFEAMGVGSTGQTELSRTRVGETDVVCAPTWIQEAFGDRARPMRLLAVNLLDQNRVLAETRDLLLPRLISGELGLSDLGANLEPVA